jgi:hypothetical protein
MDSIDHTRGTAWSEVQFIPARKPLTLAQRLALSMDPSALFEHCVGGPADLWQAKLMREVAVVANDLSAKLPRRFHVGASRSSGKSECVSICALFIGLYSALAGRVILVISPSERQSLITLDRIRQHLYAVPASKGSRIIRENVSSFTIANGTTWIGLPGSQDGNTARGYNGAGCVVVDECARVSRETLQSVTPQLSTSRGILLCLSTPVDRTDYFGEIATRQLPDWSYHEARASENPRIDPEFLESERRSMGQARYACEYELSYDMAGGESYFDREMIRAAIKPAGTVPPLELERR